MPTDEAMRTPLWSVLRRLAQERLQRVWQRPRRALRLCETLSLGERRFLALVECENQRFLVGGTTSSVALLAELPAARTPGSAAMGAE